MSNFTCGQCLKCVKDEGKPYWCCGRDMYYFVTENDKACEMFCLDVQKGDEE